MRVRAFLLSVLVLSGCDLAPSVATTAVPNRPVPADPTPPPSPPSLTGLGNPFADVYPAEHVGGKALIKDLAVVDGRIYLGHGSTNSHVPVRPVYYDVGAGRWGADDVEIHQEATLGLQVGPSGRLYASSDDAEGIDGVLLIRRELDGTWTERVVDRPENHSRDTYEWADPQTGETLVFVQNSSLHFPDVAVSYDGGESFVNYGREESDVPRLLWYKFFSFGGELYAASRSSAPIPGRPAPTRRPYLVRYTRDRDRPFEVVAFDRADVFSDDGSQVDHAVEFGGRVIAASASFHSGDALTRDRMTALPVPGWATDLVRVGEAVYLLAVDVEAGTSVLYVTRDGLAVEEVATFDRRFSAVEYADGAFYLAESGGGAEHSLWRFVADS